MKKCLFFSCFTLLLYINAAACLEWQEKVDTTATIFIKDRAYWQKVNPVMFLDTLKKYPRTLFVICVKPEASWYRSAYKRALLKNLKSNIASGKAVSVYENNAGIIGDSRLGLEAKKLLKGLEVRNYPPY